MGNQHLRRGEGSDGSKHSIPGPPLTVNPGTASKLVVTQQPSSTATAGTAFATQPKLTVQDSFGNTVTSYGTAITAAETRGGDLNTTATRQTTPPANGGVRLSGVAWTQPARRGPPDRPSR